MSKKNSSSKKAQNNVKKIRKLINFVGKCRCWFFLCFLLLYPIDILKESRILFGHNQTQYYVIN